MKQVHTPCFCVHEVRTCAYHNTGARERLSHDDLFQFHSLGGYWPSCDQKKGCWLPFTWGVLFRLSPRPMLWHPPPLEDPQNECGTPSTTIHIMHTTKWAPSGTAPPKSVHTSRRPVPEIVLHTVKFSHFVHKVDAHVRLKNTLNRFKLPK